MALAAQPDFDQANGCCRCRVAGVELVADPAGLLWWPDEQALIVSDLHLEKGSSFARRGRMLPPYDTGATLKRLQQAIDTYRPDRLIALGDSFHDAGASSRLPLVHRRQLDMMASGREWIWIAGNHDPDPPAGLAGMVADRLTIGPLHFVHEPDPNAAPGEISGHLHPKARLVINGRSIRRRCFVTSYERLILPAFGAYTGGLNVLDKAYDGLFCGRRFHALMLGDAQVYKIAGRELR